MAQRRPHPQRCFSWDAGDHGRGPRPPPTKTPTPVAAEGEEEPQEASKKKRKERATQPKLTPDLLLSDGSLGFILRYFPAIGTSRFADTYKPRQPPKPVVAAEGEEEPQEVGKKKRMERATRPKLTPDLHLSDGGLGFILCYFLKAFKPRARPGHEVEDLGNLIKLYVDWHSRLIPYYSFEQFVCKVEKVGDSNRVREKLIQDQEQWQEIVKDRKKKVDTIFSFLHAHGFSWETPIVKFYGLKGSEQTIPPTAMHSFLQKYKELRHGIAYCSTCGRLVVSPDCHFANAGTRQVTTD